MILFSQIVLAQGIIKSLEQFPLVQEHLEKMFMMSLNIFFFILPVLFVVQALYELVQSARNIMRG